ncbi:MAG TPA: AI-2E family transporter [Rhodospirillaceae bacterium]|nr:AI-2E family transporter [Rhodospirillaceae bacterium]
MGLAVSLGLIYLLSSILLPFVAGMAIAYFLDPLAQRLGRIGFSRALAAACIELGFFLLLGLAVLALAPLVEAQISSFAARIPGYTQGLLHRGEPIWRTAMAHLSAGEIERLTSAAGDYAGTAASWLGGFITRLLSGSLMVVNILSLIFITPVVTFYFLRDWQGITTRVERWLPRRHSATICQQLREIDSILAGFVRGQALVCLSLASYYALALSLVGLDLGLLVGFTAGAFSFIPYLGSISGFLVATGLALAQSQDWSLALMVMAVFAVGNLLEGNVLAPKLVGEKIGLHPIWVIFALLAGGALFGFVGILLALPTAAVIGVLTRFALARYMESAIYDNDPSGAPPR